MNTTNFRSLLVGLSMMVAAGLALALTPRHKMTDESGNINLETMIPKQFGQWKQDTAVVPTIYSPDIQKSIDKTYYQILDRTYTNSAGNRIMLMIAYTGKQDGSTEHVHRPEICYPAQGFRIGGMTKAYIDAGNIRLPVMKLVAAQGPRIEPITYWIMMGNFAVRGELEQHMARFKYTLTGKIPYGILIRVSTISPSESRSYQIEEEFVRDMLTALPTRYRRILSGSDG